MHEEEKYLKGRGAQLNTANPFSAREYAEVHPEGLDEPLISNSGTRFFQESPKNIINKINSPDLGMAYSMNPYQGCEHGCVYCYARNTHQYWGFSAGLDFERKIIVKENAPALLEKALQHPKWEPNPIMFSGNTDCYQPVERKLGITRKMLEVLLKYRHPVSMITKNALILRDIDLLKELAGLRLVHVSISITTLNEKLRGKLEPRTAGFKKRLSVVKELSSVGIPVNVMVAPVIPGLNSHEIPRIIEAVAENGASTAAYTILRLNGQVGTIFEDWIRKNYPNRAEKVLNQVAECHGGRLNDSRFGVRMKGEGNVAGSIASLFRAARKKYLGNSQLPPFDLDLFRSSQQKQLRLSL